MKFLETKEIKVGQVKANPWNPNKMSGPRFQLLKDYLSEYGPLGTIWVRPKDGGFEIIDGEQRWRAYQELGLEKIRCDVIEVDDVEARYLTLAANEIRGVHDPLKEAEVLGFLVDNRSVEEVLMKTIHKPDEVDRLLSLVAEESREAKKVAFTASEGPKVIRLMLEYSGEDQKLVSEALAMTGLRDENEAALAVFKFYFQNFGRVG